MSQEYIEIRGARENNLKEVSIKVPKRKITIFTGVSGSGKSSIVFDTIATEAQRQLYENFSMFVRNFLPRYAPPQADAIENLSMPIVVDQKKLGGGSNSTVGTITVSLRCYGCYIQGSANLMLATPIPFHLTTRRECVPSAAGWERRWASLQILFLI
jgi:excinuclease UvrABC ATPase subunit